MPELPEVETVRAGLAEVVAGAKVTKVEIHDQRSLKRHPASSGDFVETLTGRTIQAAVRRGKFLWLPLNRKRRTAASSYRPSRYEWSNTFANSWLSS